MQSEQQQHPEQSPIDIRPARQRGEPPSCEQHQQAIAEILDVDPGDEITIDIEEVGEQTNEAGKDRHIDDRT